MNNSKLNVTLISIFILILSACGGSEDEYMPKESDTPTAHAQRVNVNKSESIEITLTGGRPGDNKFIYSVDTNPRYGTLSGVAPNLLYTAPVDYSGYDSFIFSTSDGKESSKPATVNIRIVNNAPVAFVQKLTIAKNSVNNTITLSASDYDGDDLTYDIDTSTNNGVLIGSAPHLKYTPNAHFEGNDGFVFSVSDGTAPLTYAKIFISVKDFNTAPIANDTKCYS